MKGLSGIVYIAIAIGIFFTFVDPQYKEVQALLEEKRDNDELLDKARDLRKKRQELTDRYNSISREEREQLTKVLPETVDNVRLILDIDNIARNYGIILRGISISGDIEDLGENSRVVDRTSKNYGVINLSFSFSAPYDVFKSFMIDLENSLRIVDIRDFSINASDTDEIYDYSLSLDTYWLR